MSVKLSGNKIARGEAECYFIATQHNRNTIASLFKMYWYSVTKDNGILLINK